MSIFRIKCLRDDKTTLEMPPRPKVSDEAVIDAILNHENAVEHFNGKIPAYSSNFYKEISRILENNCNAQDVYRRLHHNRNGIRTAVFKKLGIPEPEITENVKNNTKYDVSKCADESLDGDPFDIDSDLDDADFTRNESFSENEVIFDLILKPDIYELIKPIRKKYKNRERRILQPEVWTHIISREFWRQFRLPCSYNFKKAQISDNPDGIFLKIIGCCKSKLCGNEFYGITKREPYAGQDLKIQVKTNDTSEKWHEELARPVSGYVRQVIGHQVVTEGAANCQRRIASEEMLPGDVRPPVLPYLPVLRKLRQETRDKKLGLTAGDGQNPILTLQRLKYTPPYVGSIHDIGLDDFSLHVFTSEMIQVMKEYCRIYDLDAEISMDSTGGLADQLIIAENRKSGHIFATEVIININGLLVSTGFFLSVSQDTATYCTFLMKWLKAGAPKPKRAVCDYSKALLGAMSQVFNSCPVKQYVEHCFAAVQTKNKQNRPAPTFIRVDVAHFMAIVCRSKCFTKKNTAVKDFLVRSIALLVSCDDFHRFEEILTLILTVTWHRYDGEMLDNVTPMPAKLARLKLMDFIATEQHAAMKIVPDEESEEFKNNLLKMSFTEGNFKCVLDRERNSSESINQWMSNLEKTAQAGDTVGQVANAYHLPEFYQQVRRLAKEFPLWTGVMAPFFKCQVIRATSAPSEGHFNELKNRILHNYESTLPIHKLFIEYWRSVQGTAAMASSKLVQILMERQKNKKVKKTQKNSLILCEDEHEGNDDCFEIISRECASSTICEEQNIESAHYHEMDNWRDKGKKEDPLLTQTLTDSPKSKKRKKSNDDDRVNFKQRKPTLYFSACPEIRYDKNQLASGNKIRKRKLFLQNGSNFKQSLRIEGCSVILKNSCPFDSTAMILSTAAVDNEQYMNYIVEKSTTNETFKFITTFVEHGESRRVYVQRCMLLRNGFTQHSGNSRNEGCRIIDCFTSLNVMWDYLMKHEGSIKRIQQCENNHTCLDEKLRIPVYEPILRKKGFKALEESLILESIMKNVRCRELDCTGALVKDDVVLNHQIFIELDVTLGLSTAESMSCVPTDFPVVLTLNRETFRLAGLIIYASAHFKALCRRSNGKWEIYNDLDKKKTVHDVKKLVTPYAALYIKYYDNEPFATQHTRYVTAP